MTRPDRWDGGDWNAQCFRCGRKRKASELRRYWEGFWVCPEHWEERQPQDFVKGVPDNTSVPWSQPAATQYIGPPICTPAGRTATPGLMIPGCTIPSWTQEDGYFVPET